MPESRLSRVEQLEALRRKAEEDNDREVGSLVEKIKESRREVETALSRLAELAEEMRGRSRRVPSEASSSLTVFATAHLRFASAVSQGLKRTASMDRVLDRAKADQEEAKRREALEKQWADRRQARKDVERLILPVSDDDAFDGLYGEIVDQSDA